MSTIYRGTLDNLWIKLQSNETLGILDSGYLEDYFGNDGQVTLHHIPTGDNYPLVMAEVPTETPEVPHDAFRGMTSLGTLPNGAFEVRGRCRDLVGNYTVFGSVQSPYGGESVIELLFSILPGWGSNSKIIADTAMAYAGVSVAKLTDRGITAGKLSRLKV